MVMGCQKQTKHSELLLNLKPCVVGEIESCKDALTFGYRDPNQSVLAGCLLLTSQEGDQIQTYRYGFSFDQQSMIWQDELLLPSPNRETISAQLIFLDPRASNPVSSCDDPRMTLSLTCTDFCMVKFVEGAIPVEEQITIDFKSQSCTPEFSESDLATIYKSCIVGKQMKVGDACEVTQNTCQASGKLIEDPAQTGILVCDAKIEIGTELCSPRNADEDCDGKIDEGFDLLDTDCTPENMPGGATCQNQGFLNCRNGTEVYCQQKSPDQLDPREIECDGVDDDCDGKIDEDYPQYQTYNCNTGCAVVGFLICENGVERNTCQTMDQKVEGDDGCDGIDNDCDGQTDENTLLDMPTGETCGKGVCQVNEVIRCTAGQQKKICEPKEQLKSDEICDGQDNNCDGEIDNVLEGCLP
jgi:hypothetical protein